MYGLYILYTLITCELYTLLYALYNHLLGKYDNKAIYLNDLHNSFVCLVSVICNTFTHIHTAEVYKTMYLKKLPSIFNTYRY